MTKIWKVDVYAGSAGDADRPRTGRPVGGPLPNVPDTPEGQLARRVRSVRVERGWSQADLAAKMSQFGQAWHQTTVAKTERAEREPRYTELLALARSLDVGVDALMGLDELSRATELGLHTHLHRLEQEEQLIELRLGYVERDIAALETQRRDLRQRRTELQRELRAARKGNTRTTVQVSHKGARDARSPSRHEESHGQHHQAP